MSEEVSCTEDAGYKCSYLAFFVELIYFSCEVAFFIHSACLSQEEEGLAAFVHAATQQCVH